MPWARVVLLPVLRRCLCFPWDGSSYVWPWGNKLHSRRKIYAKDDEDKCRFGDCLGVVMFNRGLSLSGYSFPIFYADSAKGASIARIEGDVQVVETQLEPGDMHR